MRNLKFEVKGKSLIITVPDFAADGPPSSSGKTKLVASTGGAVDVLDADRPGLKLALNLTVPNR